MRIWFIQRVTPAPVGQIHEALVALRNSLTAGSWSDQWEDCWMGHLATNLRVQASTYVLERHPVAMGVIKALGFRSVEGAIQFNDREYYNAIVHRALNRQGAAPSLLARVDRGIRITAPAPEDPLAGAQSQLASNDPVLYDHEISRSYVGVYGSSGSPCATRWHSTLSPEKVALRETAGMSR